MITGWVDGVQKGQNIDYVIYGWSLIKLKGTEKLTVQGEQVYLKDSKYIVVETRYMQQLQRTYDFLIPWGLFKYYVINILTFLDPIHPPCNHTLLVNQTFLT